MSSVSAIAHNNIALIKYWGKANVEKNLPATGSLSLTLDACYTQTSLKESEQDVFWLQGKKQQGNPLQRVTQFLDHVRALSGSHKFCEVHSENHVPTGVGLASSASGFAALAVAANKFYNLNFSPRELSQLARVGSGSAARSIFPAWVCMHQEGYAEPVEQVSLELNILVVHCSESVKKMSSRQAMTLTADTSPYYDAWISTHPKDMREALQALQDGDFARLGSLTELSTLKMHAGLMASNPGVWYFEPLSIQVMNYVREQRSLGLEGYFTLDAGPQVKVLCYAKDSAMWLQKLQNIPGVFKVELARPGVGAYLA